MATGKNIKTYFEGAWHDGDVPIKKARATFRASPPTFTPTARGSTARPRL